MNVQQQRVNIDLSKTTDILCEKCQCPHFMEVMRLKRLSMLISPTGKEEIIPIQTLLCVGCGAEFGAKSDDNS